jgi:hypothetical protein
MLPFAFCLFFGHHTQSATDRPHASPLSYLPHLDSNNAPACPESMLGFARATPNMGNQDKLFASNLLALN